MNGLFWCKHCFKVVFLGMFYRSHSFLIKYWVYTWYFIEEFPIVPWHIVMITRYCIIVYAHENQRYTKQINDKPVVNFNKQLLAKNVAVQKLVGSISKHAFCGIRPEWSQACTKNSTHLSLGMIYFCQP